MMNETPMNRYLATLRGSLGPLTLAEREEILREIAAHIRDSAEQSGASVEGVLERLGPPEKLAAEYRDGLLIRQASHSFSPLVLLRAMLRLAAKGVFGMLVFLCALFGYVTGGAVILTAFVKPFLPTHVGFFWGPNNYGFGLLFPEPAGQRELLGSWYIPVALVFGSLLLVATTWAIRLFLRASQRLQLRLGSPRSTVFPAVLAVALLGLGGHAASAQATTSTVAGDWKGMLSVQGQELHLALHLSIGPDGKLAAKLDSVDQGAMGIPCSDAALNGAAFSFSVPAIQGHYEGRLSADGSTIAGTWSQGSASLPLAWTRGSVAAPDRPQEPRGPFPYAQEEVTVVNEAANVRLAGTLTKPNGPGPFPAVFLITGSGPQDRDETVFGHKPFLVLADYMTRRGVAVLRVDDRGTAKSTGDFRSATSQDFAGDALAAVEFLKARKDVDPAHIGLIGHSEGGMIAPMVAVESRDVAFIVLMAGPGVPGDVLLPQQVYRGALAEGASEEKAAQEADEEAAELHILESEPDPQKALAEMQARARSEEEKQQLAAQARSLTSAWFRFFVAYDPYPTLKKVTCPVLALSGSKDFQVPADLNLPFIRTAVEWNPRSKVVEVPGVNHLFQDATTGAESEYVKIPETISPKVLETIGDWISQQISQTS